MAAFILKNLVQLAAVAILVLSVVFIFSYLTGDPIALYAPLDASPEQREALREALGLNDPLYVQYFRYMRRAVVGDFGNSIRMGKPALPLILERLPATAQLGLIGITLAALIGGSIGIRSALKPGGWIDNLGRVLALATQAVPNFWLGLMMILLFSVRLRLLPAFGRGQIRHLVMPVLTYAAYNIPVILRLTRSSVFDVIHQDYVRTARAKGVPKNIVTLQHIVRNAALPIITVLGMNFGHMLAGAIVIETVFAWPGVGLLTLDAIYLGDYPITMASTSILVLGVVVVNFIVDILYGVLDPRIRHTRMRG